MGDIMNYLTTARDEFKNVTWPSRREAVRLTLFVLGGSLLVGLLVGGVDSVLLRGLEVWIKIWTI